MKKALKLLFSLFLFLFFSWIIYLNCKLYYQPQFTTGVKFGLNTDLLNHLRFLKKEMHKNAADEMQQYYPEGFLFTNVLYGLAWCEVAKEVDHSTTIFTEARTEINFAYSEINSEKGKKVFDKNLAVPYGIFYAGWNNYLLGKKISLEFPNERDTSETAQYNTQCNQISEALKNPNTPYPESYANAAWPSDAMVAVASLAMEKKINSVDPGNAIHNWVERIKTKLDTNGLIPHSVAFTNGNPEQFAEGNSQSLVLNFLFEIDPAFARQQFKIYRAKFLTTRFGLPAIRQFPDGAEGSGDVDSGPVIFGIGGAASIIGVRVMTIFGDQKNAIGLRNSIEAFGCAFTSNGEKKYIFGKLPMADAFIAWTNSLEASKAKALSTNGNWRWKFQLYSFLAFVVMVFVFIKTWNIKLIKKSTHKPE